MKLEPGFIVVIVAMALFYLRLIQLRGRRRKELRDAELERAKARQRRKSGDTPVPMKVERPMFQVASWYLVAGGAVLMLVGLGMRTSSWFPAEFQPYWWVVTTLGVLVFTFSLK